VLHIILKRMNCTLRQYYWFKTVLSLEVLKYVLFTINNCKFIFDIFSTHSFNNYPFKKPRSKKDIMNLEQI